MVVFRDSLERRLVDVAYGDIIIYPLRGLLGVCVVDTFSDQLPGHTSIDSVDCGAASDSWNETIIQLWESPSEIGKTKFMTTLKALGILNKVGSMKPYDLEAEVKFEYGNSQFHTAQLFVNDFEIRDQKLIMKLAVEKTDCKAKAECGVVEAVKEVVLNGEPCCSPDGNCC